MPAMKSPTETPKPTIGTDSRFQGESVNRNEQLGQLFRWWAQGRRPWPMVVDEAEGLGGLSPSDGPSFDWYSELDRSLRN